MKQKDKLIYNPMFWLIMALTLGLMPYIPEPHVWEKLKWTISDTHKMQPIDWFDLLLHGMPWIFLVVSFTRKLYKNKHI